MKRSGVKSKINFDASIYAVNGLQKSEVLELKDAFDLLDVQKSNKIEPSGTSILIQNFKILLGHSIMMEEMFP